MSAVSEGSIGPLPTRVFLTGYMGAGKSTLGRLLSQKLNYRFLDTDQQLVKQFRKPIAKVFEEEGEAVFRKAEADLVHSLLQETGLVISTGGGTLTRDETLYAVLSQPDTVLLYLEAPVDVLFERVIFSRKDRPLLNVPNSEDLFKERFEQRRRYYEQAHLRISTHIRRLEGPSGLLDEIAQQLSRWKVQGAPLSSQ